MFSGNILMITYWLFALMGALVFWRRGGWYVLAPIAAFGMGVYLFLENPNVFSLAAKGVLLISLLSLEVIFLKYSMYEPEEEEIIIVDEPEAKEVRVP